jgi:hypothetical protein
MFDRGLFLSLHAIRRQLAAMPYDVYLVRLIHHATRTAFPGERLWTAAQLGQESTVRFLHIRNREGCDIYVQPYADNQNAGYILLDLDHTDAATLEWMRVNGHQPCVVLQTSPGHLQAWIQVSAVCLEPTHGHRDRQTVGPHLQRRLGQRRLASSGTTGWVHQPETPPAPERRVRSLGATVARAGWLGDQWCSAGTGRRATDTVRPQHRICYWIAAWSRPRGGGPRILYSLGGL